MKISKKVLSYKKSLKEFQILYVKLRKLALDLIFPTFCVRCEKFGNILCEECTRKICRKEIIQYCAVCDKESVGGVTHKKCKREHSIGRLLVASKFDKVEKLLIYELKYKNNKETADTITKIIEQRFPDKGIFKDFYLCPIPLHKKRQMIRGFNQSELLAIKLKKIYKNKGISNLISRAKPTIPQSQLNKMERSENIKNAFTIKRFNELPEKVLLVDDLTTSGSTFKEAAKLLKKEGIKEVWCLAFARGR